MLILIRGLPGSGKSTLAKTLVDIAGYKHFEAGMFFIHKEHICFDATKLIEAHAWCREMTRDALENGHNVVVSNTFSRLWEMEFYVNMAHLLDVPITVIEAKGEWKNIHGAPDDVIARMEQRWETL